MSQNLAVTPEYLAKLAAKQDAAKDKATEAAGAASGLKTAVWVTHGVISGASNTSFSSAEEMRRSAGGNLATAASDLAAKLRTAKIAYQGVDWELAEDLDKQVLPK